MKRLPTITMITATLLWSMTAGLLAQAPTIQHAETYTGREEITGWLMSEKLDGIRGVWTGQRLVTRKGRVIHAPAWFVAALPPFPVDGELWRRRNDFNFVQTTVMDSEPTAGWREITYNIFEVPGMNGDFPARLARAAGWFSRNPAPHVKIIDQIVCRGPDHLNQFLQKVESLGGEGVIVKDPRLDYHTGRTPFVLKVKSFADMEGTVIGHNPGKGKFEGLLGSLALKLDNAVVFNLGTGFTIAQRRDPPPIGAVVTFTYQGMTHNGVPRFASFLRVRKD